MKNRIPLYFLIIITLVVAVVFVISAFLPDLELIQTPTARLLANIIAIGAMIQSAIFSFLLIKQADINRKNSDDITARAEEFRAIDFISSNYALVEFHDYMLMYRESERYTQRLREKKDFRFYMRHNGVDIAEVLENFDNYTFLTVKLPLKVVVGDVIGAVKFIDFRLDREDGAHNFVPCCDEFQGLILWNESKKRQELSINLILPKGSGFYNEKTITPFSKIKVFLSMHSMLGVVVKGWTELYFTNPQKRERDGANRYMISSSQFKISGMPELESTIRASIKGAAGTGGTKQPRP